MISYSTLIGDLNHRDSRITEIPVAKSVEDNTHELSTKEQPTYYTIAYDHEGLVSLGVDRHKVGDIWALINSLIPSHHEGSQAQLIDPGGAHSPKITI